MNRRVSKRYRRVEYISYSLQKVIGRSGRYHPGVDKVTELEEGENGNRKDGD